MEEADQILLISLRQVLGAELLEDVQTAADVSCALLVRACTRCLATISPEAAALSESLPPDMAGRFKIGTELASRIQQLGFRGNIGFHQLLYPNEMDVRQILMFLFDRLPKAAAADEDAQVGGVAAAVRAALAPLVAAKRAPEAPRAPASDLPFWTTRVGIDGQEAFITSQPWPQARVCPSLLHFLGEQAAAAAAAERKQLKALRSRSGGGLSEREQLQQRFGLAITAGIGEGYAKHLSTPAKETQRQGFGADAAAAAAAAASAAAAAAAGAGAGEAPVAETAADRVLRREAELAELQLRLQQLGEQAGQCEAQVGQLEGRAKASRLAAQAEAQKTKQLEAEYTWRKQASSVLTGTAESLASGESELVAAVEAARARLRALEEQWDVAKKPFELQLEARNSATRKQRERAEEQLRCIQEWRTEIRELAASARAREQEQQRLLTEYESAPKNVNAATFVRRITEIIKNIKKQEVEVVKIIADTREMQREVNSAQETLSRAFVLVDEMIFRDAKKDDLCKEAYKVLSAIHAGFSELTQKVEETGRVARAIRDLERKMEDLAKSPLDLEKVEADIAAVAAENAELLRG